jgi:hypothetical protein
MSVKSIVKDRLYTANLLGSVQHLLVAMEATHHRMLTGLHRVLHRAKLPKLDARDLPVVAALRADAGFSTTVAALDIPHTATMLEHADRLLQELALSPKQTGSKCYLLSAPGELVTNYAEVIRWGLNERLLAIAENYIGRPVTYRGVQARLDFPDGIVDETRLWHLDQEDSRIMKIIVYLDDVDDDGGPFEYISLSARTLRPLAKGPKLRIPDEDRLVAVVPRHEWRSVLGPRGTVAFADTCSAFHRGRLPTGRTRKTLFFCYNSTQPIRPSFCPPLFVVDRFLDAAGPLTARQRSALNFSYLTR